MFKIKKLAELFIEKIVDLSVGITYTQAVSACVGWHTAAGVTIAINPVILLTGVIVGAIAIPLIREIHKKDSLEERFAYASEKYRY